MPLGGRQCACRGRGRCRTLGRGVSAYGFGHRAGGDAGAQRSCVILRNRRRRYGASRQDRAGRSGAAPRTAASRARDRIAALGNRLTAEEAQTKSLADQLAALNRRIDEIAAASQNATKQAGTAAAAADAAKQAAQDAVKDTQKSASADGIQQSDIDAVTNRITALESAVKTLSDNAARSSGAGADTTARLSVAAEALRAAVERGVPYQAELAAVQSLGGEQKMTAPLEPFAASGVPSAASLSRELAALAPALQQTVHAAPGETTFLSRLEANAQNSFASRRSTRRPVTIRRPRSGASHSTLRAPTSRRR